MVLRLKKENEGTENEEMQITLTNGHRDFMKVIREKYDFANEAQALDFMLKAVGDTKEKAETITVGGITYTPDGYDKEG